MSVQRWSYKHNEVGHGVYPDDKGELMAWDDYDALASVCREMMPFVQAAIEDTNSKVIEAWGKRLKAKALALLRFPRPPGLSAPFMEGRWRVATNGKAAVFLKGGHVDTPTLQPPDCSRYIDMYEKAVEDPRCTDLWKPIYPRALPPALYEMELCEFCNMAGCDECNGIGREYRSASPLGKHWLLAADGEHYLFDLDLLHRLDSVGKAMFTILPDPFQILRETTIHLALFTFRGGFAAIMGMQAGDDCPPKPKPDDNTF